jgi:hypothetical protein
MSLLQCSTVCHACHDLGQEGRFAAQGVDRRPNISLTQRFLSATAPAEYGDQYSSAASRGLNRSPRGSGDGGSESSDSEGEGGSESSDLEDEDY